LSGSFTFDDGEAGFGDFEVGGEEFYCSFIGFAFVRSGGGMDDKMRVVCWVTWLSLDLGETLTYKSILEIRY